MSTSLVIRKAEIDDIQILVDLLTSLFSIETDFSIDKQRQQRGLLLMLEQTEKSCVLVAEYNGRVVGMCTGQLLVSTSEGGLKAIVEDVVIEKDKRGLGIGSALLGEVEKWAINSGASRMDLLADHRNYSALNFYNSQKWKRTELIALQKHL
ncbi:GNAT family N-acetyltransferase [Clostridium sp.]|uniref:GNAT family N-acetyltransferase n=1 Tax=Clostridium sp. TaxID=1506 RepID=UPI00284D9471|nr:GNAT family N-acetyltransferase [Clostridium sp.]MDR3598329.1 GNAT family N-acetyltransferase [Clostridium sp.]